MQENDYFIMDKPSNSFLSTIVDYYFHIDMPVSQLSLHEEYIIPFPRITFGYFFKHPFLATNHTLNQTVLTDMCFSRISLNKISVQPQSSTIKIVGAHMRPFSLAYFSNRSIADLPWLTKAADLFPDKILPLEKKITHSQSPEQMFQVLEHFLLENILVRYLSVIINAVQLIEASAGNIQLKELAEKLGVSERTVRIQFVKHVGCSPKEFMRLVKMKQIAYQMKYSTKTLTHIAYENEYFDQAHFIHDVKNTTSKSPKELRSELPAFRFLQF